MLQLNSYPNADDSKTSPLHDKVYRPGSAPHCAALTEEQYLSTRATIYGKSGRPATVLEVRADTVLASLNGNTVEITKEAIERVEPAIGDRIALNHDIETEQLLIPAGTVGTVLSKEPWGYRVSIGGSECVLGTDEMMLSIEPVSPPLPPRLSRSVAIAPRTDFEDAIGLIDLADNSAAVQAVKDALGVLEPNEKRELWGRLSKEQKNKLTKTQPSR